MLRVDTDDPNLTLDDMPTNWGGGWLFNGNLFTGIMYEYYPNTNQLRDEAEFKDGILGGRQVEYWPNGNMKVEYFQKYDSVYGSFKKWDEQGILISHSEYDQFGHLVKTIL